MTFARKILVPLLILTALLTACGSGLATSTPVDANSISTSLVGTLVASLFQTQTALVPPALTSTPVPPSPLSPLGTVVYPTVIFQTPTTIYYYPTLSTIIPSVTGTVYTPTVNPLSLASGCNNLAFVRDVTVPDGTVFAPKQDFVKTWKVANTGTCKWEYQYEMVLLSGNAFNAKSPTKLNFTVDVGDWSEISIGMGAPKNPGDYTSYWRLADSNGSQFGATLAVSFTVSSPTAVPSTNTPVPTSTTAPPPSSTSTSTPTDTPTPP